MRFYCVVKFRVLKTIMDELINAFAGSQVTHRPNSTAAEHPHFALYKAKSKTCNQEARRKKFLEAQKCKRYDYANHVRGLALDEWGNKGEEKIEIDDEEIKDDDVDMSVQEYICKPSRSYKNQLMLSEWLVEVPDDLAEMWYLVLCPVGKRCLVVASKGYTRVYSKSGYLVTSFQSYLPGGNKRLSGSPLHVYTVVDCIYNEVDRIYYILDIMSWNSHPCVDTEVEFRFYWFITKTTETPGLQEVSRHNVYKFLPLPHFKCDTESIKNAIFSELPFPSKLDGLLFYHKKSHYIMGSTPLVGWLKAYMLPELLNIDIPAKLSAEKPASYVSMKQHIPEEVFEEHKKRKENEERTMQCD
ncbi:snurportin-1 [Caerostris darwini]|uniref:Snurportin-1 n=1 Tax=Caerostris darwini TaxID=1538125 RepID=A0AAV4X1R5_9ARAC|nr:snurportin-1 [Caerostris darwini]